jgi:outer membrane lipoprotein-sorting protein
MNSTVLKIAAIAVFCLCLSVTALAATSADQQIARIETSIQSISTLKARFIQTDNLGQQLTGTFYLSRPGKMRFEYDPPTGDFVVADGVNVYYYDAKLKQQSSALISQTLAHFFLRPEIKLSGDIKVADVIKGGGLLQARITRSKDPGAGSLTFGFAEDKKKQLQLKKWRVIDEQGAVTEIELFDTESGITLSKNLFRFINPAKSDNRINN